MSVLRRAITVSLASSALALLLCACGATDSAPAEVTRIAKQVYATQTAQARSAAATRAPTRAVEPTRTAPAAAMGEAIEFVITDDLALDQVRRQWLLG